MDIVADNIAALQETIAWAARAAGCNPATVSLVAVSKNQEAARIEEALNAGQRLFGENRVQEAYEHWEHRRQSWPDINLHLIGPLQTNKVRDAVDLFDCIETVDRESLAAALAKEMTRQGKFLPCFIQVNTGEEKQKGGVAVSDLSVLLAYCRKLELDIRGLMCIPPVDQPPAMHFALLRKLARRHGLAELSMGMSADFEQAVALGATYVRIGSALFGTRA